MLKKTSVRDQNNYGLYTPSLEKDACGIGMIAQYKNKASHQIIADALTMLERMEHRGACGCDENSGDGAGILTKIPHKFFKAFADCNHYFLPSEGHYGVGFLFLPKDKDLHEEIWTIMKAVLEIHYFQLLFYRPLVRNSSILGVSAAQGEPDMIQLFVQPKISHLDTAEFERKLYVLRNHITRMVVEAFPFLKEVFYFPSFSSKTIIYKGQLKATQLRLYYQDLQSTMFESALAIVHSRFSTNTIPRWKLAQPFRAIAHNGEINTINGNVSWWQTRESMTLSKFFSTEELKKVFPVCSSTLSDSGNFDAVLEFLFRNGYTIGQAMMMMMPEAHQNDTEMSNTKKAFYQYYESMMEPWDGPAAVCFTDGSIAGTTIDRNGLRPARYCITNEDTLYVASEAGILDIDQNTIIKKGNIQPGQMIIADLKEQKLLEDNNVKEIITTNYPYSDWLSESNIFLQQQDQNHVSNPHSELNITYRLICHTWTEEDKSLILNSMVNDAQEPISSMGSDIPLAILSDRPQKLFDYFKQDFAQVTNPPIGPLREDFFMSLHCYLGGRGDLWQIHQANAHVIKLKSPILSSYQWNEILQTDLKLSSFHAYYTNSGPDSLEISLLKIREACIQSVKDGARLINIDNTISNYTLLPIPSLLICGCVHQGLIEAGFRNHCSIIMNGGDIIESHHVACLLAFGADAVYPSLSIEYIQSIADKHTNAYAIQNYYKSLNKGLLKILSKIGISTILSYKGSQAFELLGLNTDVVNLCFTNAISRIGGLSLSQIARENKMFFELAQNHKSPILPESGKFQWKPDGEYHLFNPTTVHLLQHSVRTNDYQLFLKYTAEADRQSGKACTLRSLFHFVESTPISLDEVESIESIVKRFSTGAMSFGSISEQAHKDIAIAMNRLGAKSNSGEGGEDPDRYQLLSNGDSTKSAIKQVASGRFGVTIEYLHNANEIQIKMAQGAKPGEGGQLPGSKVDHNIARIRNSTEGVGLISPPPHHDIYSIEDLAQLIYDLKCANPNARISVKLVAKAGVGIIASGVAKAHADHILISGSDGGTGASPLSSIMHAGIPWEMGLAESHQTLVKNGLRERVALQTDGQIRTAKDMAIATMLGADEWCIATAALVVSGCILVRKCHLNTCPVGIATQNDKLSSLYTGTPEYLINYFTFLATEFRSLMAKLGFRTVNEMVGRSDRLYYRDTYNHWKRNHLSLDTILGSGLGGNLHCYNSQKQDHRLSTHLDYQVINRCNNEIISKRPFHTSLQIQNTDRAVGTLLSGHLISIWGSQQSLDSLGSVNYVGSAGQSFGAFAMRGLLLSLQGEANDYVGKGLCGANIVITPHAKFSGEPSENILIGNVALFGATSGEIYIRGKAGQRFAVRNSGANAIVEGIGDNGCEYMTGGIVTILGDIGRNFGAGMSGGLVYMYCPHPTIQRNINTEMVEIHTLHDRDYVQLKHQLKDHFRFTGSVNALQILNNWKVEKYNFIKVISRELLEITNKDINKYPLRVMRELAS